MPAALAGLVSFVISDKHCKTSHCAYELRAAEHSEVQGELSLFLRLGAPATTLPDPLQHAEALPSLCRNICWHCLEALVLLPWQKTERWRAGTCSREQRSK